MGSAIATSVAGRLGFLVCGVAVLTLATLACESSPSPTPTTAPSPTSTPALTPTPTTPPTAPPSPSPTTAPTATPTQAATPTPTATATAVPTQFHASITKIELNTPVREVVAMLTEEEEACIREDAEHEEPYQTFLDQPSFIFATLPPFLATCIGRNQAIDLTSAIILNAAGPVDLEECIREDVAAFLTSDDSSGSWGFAGFVCLPEELGPDVTFEYWVDGFTRDEVSCMHEAWGLVGVKTLDEFIDELRAAHGQFFRLLALEAPDCVGIDALIDIGTSAIAEGISITDIETCVREKLVRYYEDPPSRIDLLLGGPGYYRCLTRDQLAWLTTSELVVQLGDIPEEQQSCIHELSLESLDVAHGLMSGNPQDTLGITSFYLSASIFACLPAEKIAELLAGDLPDGQPIPLEAINCLRDLYGGPFLEQEITSKMFRPESDLTEEEQEALSDFFESLSACGDPGAHAQ